MNLEKSIVELLYDHDCVIIPRLGGFIGSYAPARVQLPANTFFPPFKSLLFNINLGHNDGLLASHLSKKENISYDQAMRIIDETVAEWKQILKKDQRLMIRGIGELIAEKEGNLIFRQDLSVNLLNESFGLTSFVSPAIRREYTEPVEEPGKERSIVPSLMKWAAMLALPLGIAAYFGVNQVDRLKEISANYSGIFFSPAPSSSAEHKNIYVIPKPKPSQNTQPKKVVRSDSVRKVSVKPFAIIVGAFKFAGNAENLVASLKNKGYDAAVYDVTKNGLTRVTIGTYADRKEALEQLAAARNQISSAWLLSK